jgi:hypothetical protein
MAAKNDLIIYLMIKNKEGLMYVRSQYALKRKYIKIAKWFSLKKLI